MRLIVLGGLLLAAALPAAAGDKKTIVDVAASKPEFSTLVAALKAGDLVETLQGDGPFTVFAPTNDAFAKLPAGTLDNLLKPENRDQLRSILTYHVVSGRVLASDVVKLDDATTVNGAKADVAVQGDSVTIDGAKVTATDVVADNGVIHVVDSVMLPD